ncbi:hypothetical protein MKX01_008683 [Papaver californicum]|nr:hypothetical protein MKX01_008683 [Papaver californicum]
MGRRKIEIERIDDTNKRMVTFSKRRNGLISKAAQLCKFCSDIVLIVFFPAGKPYTFSNSSLGVCHIVEQFLADQTKDTNKSKNSSCIQQCRKKNHVVLGSDHDDSLWWDNIDMEKLDSLEMLMYVRISLADLKQNLTARLETCIIISTIIISLFNYTRPYCRIYRSARSRNNYAPTTTTTTNQKNNAGKIWWKDRPELDHKFELQQSDKKAIILMLEDEVRIQDEEVEDPSTVLAL